MRRRIASEDGSLLVEVMVSAAILLTVSVGVVMALQISEAQSALQRSKALATDVAQSKLDELRAKAYNSLRPLNETATVPQGGVTFTVVSTATPVVQTGAPSGCLTSRARDYMNLRTTVTWAEMGARKPVVLQTMLAAPVGSGGGLVVSVLGASGQAVPSIPILLSSGGGTAATDSSGCARWDAVAAGTGYGITTSVAGYVQPNGEQDVDITGINIAAEETATESFAYDRGGSVRMRFTQKTTANAGDVDVDAGFLPALVSLSTSSGTIIRDVAPVSGAIGSTGSELLYPYPSTSYSIYADGCTDAKPTGAGIPAPAALVPAGGVAPSATGSVQVPLPNLDVRVTNATANTRVWVKTACDTVIGPLTLLADGTLRNPGMPFGEDFQVCAIDGSRKRSLTVDNTSYSQPSAATPNTLTLPNNNGSCPFTTS